MQQKDEYYMKQALLEAQKALNKNEVPIGAIIVFEKQIIARSHNLTKTLNDITAHAEMQAITAASTALCGKYLINCTLYVTIEPCAMCAGALGWSQIKRIVYGAKNKKRGYLKLSPLILHPKTTVTNGILAEKAFVLMKNFFQKKR